MCIGEIFGPKMEIATHNCMRMTKGYMYIMSNEFLDEVKCKGHFIKSWLARNELIKDRIKISRTTLCICSRSLGTHTSFAKSTCYRDYS